MFFSKLSTSFLSKTKAVHGIFKWDPSTRKTSKVNWNLCQNSSNRPPYQNKPSANIAHDINGGVKIKKDFFKRFSTNEESIEICQKSNVVKKVKSRNCPSDLTKYIETTTKREEVDSKLQHKGGYIKGKFVEEPTRSLELRMVAILKQAMFNMKEEFPEPQTTFNAPTKLPWWTDKKGFKIHGSDGLIPPPKGRALAEKCRRALSHHPYMELIFSITDFIRDSNRDFAFKFVGAILNGDLVKAWCIGRLCDKFVANIKRRKVKGYQSHSSDEEIGTERLAKKGPTHGVLFNFIKSIKDKTGSIAEGNHEEELCSFLHPKVTWRFFDFTPRIQQQILLKPKIECTVLENSMTSRAYPSSGAKQWPRLTPAKSGPGITNYGWAGSKKKVLRIRIGTLNVGSMVGRGSEVADFIDRRKINILCVQETRWAGNESKELGEGCKLICSGSSRKGRNGVGIALDKWWRERLVRVNRRDNRIMSVGLDAGSVILNIVCAYAPQAGCEDEQKANFWTALGREMSEIPVEEKCLLGGDLNGHIGCDRVGMERVHGGWGLRQRNPEGETILAFALAWDMAVINSYFQKKWYQYVTYKSGRAKSQIDYILYRRNHLVDVINCKVIQGEHVAKQHRPVIVELAMKLRRFSNVLHPGRMLVTCGKPTQNNNACWRQNPRENIWKGSTGGPGGMVVGQGSAGECQGRSQPERSLTSQTYR